MGRACRCSRLRSPHRIARPGQARSAGCRRLIWRCMSCCPKSTAACSRASRASRTTRRSIPTCNSRAASIVPIPRGSPRSWRGSLAGSRSRRLRRRSDGSRSSSRPIRARRIRWRMRSASTRSPRSRRCWRISLEPAMRPDPAPPICPPCSRRRRSTGRSRTIVRHCSGYRRRCATISSPRGASRRATLPSAKASFVLPPMPAARASSRCNPNAGVPPRARKNIMTCRAARVTGTSPSTSGSRRGARTRWSMSARTARSNGCRARRSRCRTPAGPRR